MPGQAKPKSKSVNYGDGDEDKENRPPSRAREQAPVQVNQLRGYKIDTPHPLKPSTGRTAEDYLAAKRRRRAERDRKEAVDLVDLGCVIAERREKLLEV